MRAKTDYIDITKYKAARKRQRVRRRGRVRAEIERLKVEMGPCAHCGEADPCCLDFHHTAPHLKTAGVSQLIPNESIRSVRLEADKCVVLCANCHRKEHKRSLKKAVSS